MTKQWDRQRNEDGELEPMMWFDRFGLYRLLGTERTLLAAYNSFRAKQGQERLNWYPGAWFVNSHKWHWKERAEAWDREQQLRRWEQEQQEIDAMNKRHLQIAMGLQSAGGRSLAALTQAIQGGDEKLTAGEIRHFLREGIELERLTRGLPNELMDIMLKTDKELLDEYGDIVEAIRTQAGRAAKPGDNATDGDAPA